MYRDVSITNTPAWMNDTRIFNGIRKQTTNAIMRIPPSPPTTIPAALPDSAQPKRPSSPIRRNIAASRRWPPVILPKRRSESESGRAQWLMSSIGSIRGASHTTGPMKCLR